MAVVEYTHAANQVFTVTAMAASDSSGPIFMDGGLGLSCSVHAADGGGTGFNAGTMTIQVSNDNVTYSTLLDIHGTAAAFAANGNFEISTGSQYIRALSDANIGNVDVIFSFG